MKKLSIEIMKDTNIVRETFLLLIREYTLGINQKSHSYLHFLHVYYTHTIIKLYPPTKELRETLIDISACFRQRFLVFVSSASRVSMHKPKLVSS